LQKQVQRKIQSGIESQTGFTVGFYQKILNGKTVTVPVKSLVQGDCVLALPGDPLQFDAEVFDDRVWVDPSSLTGESTPMLYQQGQVIPAGSVVLNSPIKVCVERLFKDSELGQTIEATLKSANDKAKWLNVTDLAAQVLMVTVLGVGVIFLYFTNAFQNPEMLERFLALIILACPCALAFGTPLAFQFSMRNALRKGIIVKSINAFFEINNIKTFVFDKTGTLTDSQAQVTAVFPLEGIATHEQIMASIQSQSYHPMAFAIRSFLNFKGPILKVSDFVVLQNGVQGIVDSVKYQFLDDSNDNSKIINVNIQKNNNDSNTNNNNNNCNNRSIKK
jgi:Cu2+-exporting ATPase/Cu+-exporting ATPase